MFKTKKLGRPRLLIVGCGDIGLRLLPLLTPRFRVFALTSSAARLPILRQAGAVPMLGNLDTRPTLWRIGKLATRVIHLAPPNPHTADDNRMQNLLQQLVQPRILTNPLRVVYMSTSGVYGDCAGETVQETRATHPESARAKKRVLAERVLRAWASGGNWQKASLETLKHHHTIEQKQTMPKNHARAVFRHGSVHQALFKTLSIVRVPGIYAQHRLPLERLSKQLPALLANEDSFTNHIHADDLAHATVQALWHGRVNRLYNICDDSTIKAADWFDQLADAHNLPRSPRMTRSEAQTILSPMQWSFLRESRKLDNTRMKAELRVRLRYATVTDFLKTI